LITSANKKSVKKIRLLYLVSNLGVSGPTNQLYNLIQHLKSNFFKTTVFTLSPEPRLSNWDKFQNLGLDMASLNLPRLSGVLLNRRHLLPLINRVCPDIIHSQGIRSDYINSRLNNYAHRVATQRNIPNIDYPMLYGKLRGRLVANVHLNLFKRIPHVIACSQSISDHNHRLGLKTKVIVNGIQHNPDYDMPREDEKHALRKKLGLPDKGELFIWSGPFIPRKMPETVIRAFNSLPSNRQIFLCLLGDGPMYSSCLQAPHSKNVIFKGHVNNVGDFLTAADGFVSTSVSEGMPNSVLESLAHGVPVILSDIPSHQEILSYSSNAGVHFPVRDTRTLAEIIQNTRFTKNNSEAARSIITEHLNAQIMSTNYQNLYFEIVNNSINT